jgi:hypothetical protein
MIALWPALKCRRRMVLLQVFPFVRVWFADVGANAPEACQFAGSAGRLASSEVSRLGGARRFAVRRPDEGLLEGRGATVHNTRIDDGMALKLDGQRLEESPALQGMDGRGGGLDGVVLVVTEAERHRARLGLGGKWMCDVCSVTDDERVSHRTGFHHEAWLKVRAVRERLLALAGIREPRRTRAN